MIVLPPRTSSSRCPNCHRPERIREVCGHCDYEYQRDGAGFGVLVILGGLLLAAVLMMGAVITTADVLMCWVDPRMALYGERYGDPCMLHVEDATLVRCVARTSCQAVQLLRRVW